MMPARNRITPAKSRAAMLSMAPMASACQGMLDALRDHGIEPAAPGEIVADGVLHRFQVASDKPGSRNGWFVLHSDHGAAGSWKTGVSCTWSAKATAKMTRQEKDAHFRAIRQAKAEAQAQREAEHQAAAERASMLWAAYSGAS